jgi:hypothetical protein
METRAGLAAPDVDGLDGGSSIIPTGELRIDWRQPGDGAVASLRATRTLVASSPSLVRNRVVREEIGGRADVVAAGPLRLRGLARTARISAASERNHRSLLGGGLVVAASLGEVSATIQQITFTHPSASGYFAPHSARVAEIGSYVELETSRGVRIAADLGAGAQQVTQWSAPAGPWKPTYRVWSEVALPLAPGRELRMELEGYDSRIGSDLATSAAWRFGAVAITLHWTLR